MALEIQNTIGVDEMTMRSGGGEPTSRLHFATIEPAPRGVPICDAASKYSIKETQHNPGLRRSDPPLSPLTSEEYQSLLLSLGVSSQDVSEIANGTREGGAPQLGRLNLDRSVIPQLIFVRS